MTSLRKNLYILLIMFSVYPLLSLIFCSVYVPETKQSNDASVTIDVISKLTQYQMA